MVKWAVASLEWIYFDTEDWNNQDQADGAYPHDAGKAPPTIYYCYYRGCNETLTEVRGTFHTPNYPGKYPDGQYCSWSIMVNVTPHIHLTFTNFSLQNEDNTDALYVYGGENATGEVLGVFYGSNPPPEGGIYSMTNQMFIMFKSDNQTGSYTGFNASYYGLNKSELDSKVTSTSAQTTKMTSPSPRTQRTSHMFTLEETTSNRHPSKSTRTSTTEGPSKYGGKDEKKEQTQKTETQVNKDAIYGSVIGVLALLLTASIINTVIKSHKRRRVDRIEEKPAGCHFNEATDKDITSHHNPLRYMVEEGRPAQPGLQGATDMFPASSLNNNTTTQPGELTWEGSRTDVIIGKITGEGTFEQATPGKVLQLRIEIKTDLKDAE